MGDLPQAVTFDFWNTLFHERIGRAVRARLQSTLYVEDAQPQVVPRPRELQRSRIGQHPPQWLVDGSPCSNHALGEVEVEQQPP